MIKTRIVVGADGSAPSVAAVSWAAAEALRRGAELRIVTAFYRSPDSANVLVHRAVAQARAVAPGVEVRCQALPGYAVPVLLHAAEEAALLVVGTRRDGGLPLLPIGSVGSQVATRARSSVVVVRGRPDEGPVVAGLDDSPASSTVAEHAFEEASLHATEVEAVTVGAHTDPMDAQLDPWRRKYPGVRASREFVDGRTDRVLVQRSRSARLVVVGPRTHGFQGLMLGAIGSRLLQRAGCPVLIAR